MAEPATSGGVSDVQTVLRREVDTLAERFPDVERAEIEDRVFSTYERLKQQATVESHLVSITEGQVTDELRKHGETVHVRGGDAG